MVPWVSASNLNARRIGFELPLPLLSDANNMLLQEWFAYS
jgi:hypothetical protein